MEIICYNVDFFRNLLFENSFVLNEEIQNNLTELEKNLVIPQELLEAQPLFRVDSNSSGNSTNSDRRFRRTNSSGGGRRGHNRGSYNKSCQNTQENENWEAIRNFKATKIEKSEGVQLYISEIRALLNKLSIKNYEVQYQVIITKLNEFIEKITDDDDKQLLLQSIFQILSMNSYLSTLYADLYVELVGIHDSFEMFIDEFVENYSQSLHEIHYIDSNEDYDGFCKYNKINDIRKCKATFIVNLMKRDMISQENILNVIKKAQEIAIGYIDEENRQNEVDEITENIVLIIKEVKTNLENTDMWKNSIQPNINYFTGLKVKEHASFTSRAKFKYMDCT